LRYKIDETETEGYYFSLYANMYRHMYGDFTGDEKEKTGHHL